MTTPGVAERAVDVCGLPVHALTFADSLARADELIRDSRPHQHVVVNAAKVVQASRDPELAGIIRSCSMINADGQSVVWASKLLGRGVPERVAGIDLMDGLWDLAATRGYRVYLLGATQDVIERTASMARDRGVNVVGYRDGYWADDSEDAVVQAVRESRADLLFLGIPTPRKEYFLARHLDALGVGLAFGVGGSFDVVAGIRRRAPRWVQRVGLEWAYRLAQEPRRMLGRYMVGNTWFAALLVRSLVKTRLHVGGTGR